VVAVVNTAMNLQVQYNVGNLFIGQFLKKDFAPRD
jgi:hypothetical protein